MSITTTITYDDPTIPPTTVQGGLVLSQEASGRIFHRGKLVDTIESEISAPDSRLVVRVLPEPPSLDHVAIDEIIISTLAPRPLTQADAGGVTWSVADGRGQDIEITAPSVIGGKRTYAFSSPEDPPVKLKITVVRT